jgi:ribosomal protein L11 methylase PrmA
MIGLAVSVGLFLLCALLIYYFYQGPVYVPTLARTVEAMVNLSEVKPGMKMVDLGSGDGRIVVAFAKAGAIATGLEINPILVWYSRLKIRKNGLAGKAQILSNSFWSQNLSEYDIVVIFGIDHVMKRLSDKLAAELKPSAIVISNAFHLPNFVEVRKGGSLIVYKK